jgi:two-component system, OmpR family, alkaline phosphatase synthesis response regulator PhoP
MARILIVEDSRDVAHGLRRNLEAAGHHVYVAMTGRTGLDRARQAIPDLVVLDFLLPGMDGRDVLATLRREGFAMPVLALTAVDAEREKVRALDLGADDYVTKPFGLHELMARIRTLLRRGERAIGERDSIYRLGQVVIDATTHQVSKQGRALALRPKEYELLLALVRRRGSVATRRDLMTEVWGYAADAMSRTLDAHIAMLRRKLEPDASHPRLLLTVRSVGYRVAE